MVRLGGEFFEKDVLEVAPLLPGKILIRKFPNGRLFKYMITETEAYRGEEDLACHASRGKTPRNQIMYEKGGYVYVYLIYGMYWMLNFVTGRENQPQAVLIRGLREINGPGRITRQLEIGKEFYGENLTVSSRLWLENHGIHIPYKTTPRIGVDYAGDWKNKPWRFVAIL